MFWHTSEHEIYLNKNKFTEVIRKRKISYPDNYAFWQTSESQKYLINTSEHEIYLNKKKSAEVKGIIHPDNYVFWHTSESQKFLIKNKSTEVIRWERKIVLSR